MASWWVLGAWAGVVAVLGLVRARSGPPGSLWWGREPIAAWQAAMADRVVLPAAPILILAYPAAVMAAGLVEVWSLVGYGIGIAVTWLVFAGPLRRAIATHGARTMAQLVARSTGGSARIQRTAAVFVVLFSLATAAGLLGIAGQALSPLTGLDPGPATAALAAVLGLAVVAGGFTGLLWGDLVLFLGLLALASVIPALGLADLSARNLSVTTALSEFPELGSVVSDLGPARAAQVVLSGLCLGLIVPAYPPTVGRLFAVAPDARAPAGALLTVGLFALLAASATLVGLVGIAGYDILSLGDPSRLVFRMAEDGLGETGAAWVVGLVAAAATSAAGSLVLAAGTALVEDLLPPRARGPAVGRAALFGLTAASAGWAWFERADPHGMLQWGLTGLAAALGPVLVLSAWWPRLTARGQGWGMGSGAATLVVAAHMAIPMSIPRMPWIFSVLFAAVAARALRLRGWALLGAVALIPAGRIGWTLLAKTDEWLGPLPLPVATALVAAVAVSLADRWGASNRR